MEYTQYTIEQNLIIKKPLPTIGVICSNKRRVERMISSHFADAIFLEEYNSAWQLDIYIGNYQGKSIFVAALPVGAAGAAFGIQQLATAGAKYIIRYGSNDDPSLTHERTDEIILVDKADNLYGLMQSSGAPPETWGSALDASPQLISALSKEAAKLGLKPKIAICHHVEDYAAYAFPHHAGEYSARIIDHLSSLESSDPQRLHCRDMESAALFYRAFLDNFHAATVLQNVPKFPGKHQTYEGAQGEIAKKNEKKFLALILNSLVQFG